MPYDETKLRDAYSVFREVFDESGMSYERFVYKHQKNPDCVDEVANLVYYENGIPQGIHSFMGQVFLYGQEEVFSLQSCDVAVRTEARGKGLFSHSWREAMNYADENKIPFLFGLPNQNSYPGEVKLGLLELGQFALYVCFHHPIRFLWRRLLKRPASSALSFEETSLKDHLGNLWTVSLRCPFSEEDCAVINAQPGIRTRRNRAYFQWKGDFLPEGRTAYFCRRENQKLLAYFMVRLEGNHALLLDWMFPEKEPAAAIRFLQHTLSRYADYTTTLVNPLTADSDAFQRGGFLRWKPYKLPLMVYFSAPPPEAFTDFKNWYLRVLDGDTVLNG